MKIDLFFRLFKSELLRRSRRMREVTIFSFGISGKGEQLQITFLFLPPSPCLLERRSVGSFSQSFSESHVIFYVNAHCLQERSCLINWNCSLLKNIALKARLLSWRLYGRRVPLKLEGDFCCAF